MQFQKYFKNSAAISRPVGGVSLIIVGSGALLFSSFFAIIAFSKGFTPHAVIASLVSLGALAAIMKGVQLFYQTDSLANNLLLRRKNAKKLAERAGSTMVLESTEMDSLKSDQSVQLDAQSGEEAVVAQEVVSQLALHNPDDLALLAQQSDVNPNVTLPPTQDKQVTANSDIVKTNNVSTAPPQAPVGQFQPIIPVTEKPTFNLFQGAITSSSVAEKQTQQNETRTQEVYVTKASEMTQSKTAVTTSTNTNVDINVSIKVSTTSNAAQSSKGSDFSITSTKPLQFVETLLRIVTKVVDTLARVVGLSSTATASNSTAQVAKPASTAAIHTPAPR